MNHQTLLRVLLSGMPMLLLTGCLGEAKTACRTNDDCTSPRVCVALVCRDHYPDAAIDAGRDSSFPGDPVAEGSVEAPPDWPEPSAKDGRRNDGSVVEVAFDSLDGAMVVDTRDGQARAEVLEVSDAPQPEPIDGEVDPMDARLPSDPLLGTDQGPRGSESATTKCDGGCEPPSLWELLGGAPASGPGVTRSGPGRNIEVFWQGADRHLEHRALLDERTWSAETDLGGTLAAEPAATWRKNNINDVFWRGPDDRLKHRWYSRDDGWSQEEDLGGSVASSPAAASWGTLALYVFWRGPDGLLKQKSLDYATNLWTDEIDVGIPVQGDPAAVYRNNGVMDVFWRGPEGTLLHVWTLDGTNWSSVQDLGRAIAADSSPTATSRQFEWVDVFWKGPDRHLKHVWMTPDNRWSLIEEDLGGELGSSPDATSWGLGRLDVFAKDALTGQLAHLVWNHEATVTLNDTNPRIDYSPGWLYSANRPFVNYGDDVHYTMTDGAYFEHRFTGTGIDYVTDYEASSGDVDIYIDGIFQATVDCSGATRMVQQIVYTKRGLPSGSHTIKAVKKNGDLMVLDALRTYP